MKFNFKVTLWDNITVDEEYEQEVFDAIKVGTVTTSADIIDLFDGLDIDFRYQEDTEKQMTIEQNGGKPTIKIFDDNNLFIYSNKKIKGE